MRAIRSVTKARCWERRIASSWCFANARSDRARPCGCRLFAGFEVVGIGDQPHYRGTRFAPGQFCRLGEVSAGSVGELHGKLILTDANERRGQAVNGVIWARATTVATGVARL